MEYPKVTIKGVEYFVYTLPVKSGVRKRLYSKTVAGLEEKIKNSVEEIPMPPKNGNVNVYMDFWLVYGQLSKKKHDEYSHVVLTRTLLKKDMKSVTDEDVEREISVSENPNIVASMLHDFISWTNKERITSLIPPESRVRQDKTYYEPLTTAQLLRLRSLALITLENEKMSLSYRYDAIVLFCAFIGLRTQTIPLITDVVKEDDNWYITTRYHRFLIPSVCHFVAEALKEEQERTGSASIFGAVSRATIANFFYSYGEKLRIPNLTPSAVRRAYGAYLIEQGIDFVKIAYLLDDNINTLYRTYRDSLSFTSVKEEQRIVNT